MAARLVNISRDGRANGVREVPGRRHSGIAADREPRTDRLGGRNDRSRDLNRQMGLRFTQGCPDDLLLAGTVGIDLAPWFAVGRTSRPRSTDRVTGDPIASMSHHDT